MGKKIGAVVFVVAFVGAIAAVYWFAIRPAQSTNASQPGGPQLPDLGSRGRPVEAPTNSADGANEETVDGGGDGADPEPQPEPEVANTSREIDIWLSNLAIATKAGDRKGIALNHDMLAKAKPDTLVDERVRNALDNEQSAWVRIQFFAAYHEPQPKFDWAMHVYDTRTAKFMGTDDLYAGGEIEELRVIAQELFAKLVASWQADGTGDFRVMALLRNAFETEQPAWLLECIVRAIVPSIVHQPLATLARSIEQEVRGFLQRRTAELSLREQAFRVFMLTYDPPTSVFPALATSEWWDYASCLLTEFEVRAIARFHTGAWEPTPEWLREILDSPELPKLFESLLAGTMPKDLKRSLIQRIGNHELPEGRSLIEAGLARKDANYADYLAAFGRVASTEEDFQRLTAAADDPDVNVALGAIEGLRLCNWHTDAELRKVLENGTNEGVKSQALGALLSRTKDKDALLEEYLAEDKDSSLRAVAVQHVPLTSVERLQRIAEEDPSPTVRLAALNRVGSIVPESIFQRKELRGWFVKMKDRDNSSVIRAAARKYAEDLDVPD